MLPKKNTIYHGDCLEVLRTFDDNSIDCCVTSPPYYALRDYGVPGQLGLEDTPEEYISRLTDIFEEVRRVLKPQGTLWLNMGDSYAGSMKGAARWPESAMNYKQGTNRGLLGKSATVKRLGKTYKNKDLLGIPWMLAFALRSKGWFLRQDIIWQKMNPMPESVVDRCTKSHEYVFLLSKKARYFYDNEAVKEKAVGFDNSDPRGSLGTGSANSGRRKGNSAGFRGGNSYTNGNSFDNSAPAERQYHGNIPNETGLRNRRDVWSIATSHGEGHFATFPEDLVRPCVLAGCPEGGIVLDPFMGSGTVGVVALQYFRNYVGIEINKDYIRQAEERIAANGENIFFPINPSNPFKDTL